MAESKINTNRLSFEVLADFYGTALTVYALSENASMFELLVFEVTDNENETCGGYTSHPSNFRDKSVKIYGKDSTQWGLCRVSPDYLSATFNRTSSTTTHVRLLGLRRV